MKKLPFTPFALLFVKFCLIISPVMFVLYIAFAVVFYPNLIPSYIAFALFIVFGMIFVIYPFIFDASDEVEVSKKKKKKPTKNKIKEKTFEEFLNNAENAAVNNGYSKISEQAFEKYTLHLYAKAPRRSKMELIEIINTDEITEEIIDSADLSCQELLKKAYGEDVFDELFYFNNITIVCVKRMNAVFKDWAEGAIWQDKIFRRFMALISFGGKALYLVEQDGYGICNRKRNKKKFFELFDFLATGG